MKALFISADTYEDSELLVPYYRFLEEGVDVDIASMKEEPIWIANVLNREGKVYRTSVAVVDGSRLQLKWK